MNDRIRKLAEQAHLYNDDDNFLTAALEHFAELIVRECVWIVDNDGSSEDIFEHFGVEE